MPVKKNAIVNKPAAKTVTKPKKEGTFQRVLQETKRLLTAEGWRRRKRAELGLDIKKRVK